MCWEISVCVWGQKISDGHQCTLTFLVHEVNLASHLHLVPRLSMNGFCTPHLATGTDVTPAWVANNKLHVYAPSLGGKGTPWNTLNLSPGERTGDILCPGNKNPLHITRNAANSTKFMDLVMETISWLLCYLMYSCGLSKLICSSQTAQIKLRR